MDAQVTRLLAAFRRAADPAPADTLSFLRGLPDAGTLPLPWVTWTLIGLVRHRERQFWVADIIRNKLRGEPDALAVGGALAHPEGVPQLGPVPGMPEWEYYFHGRGCRLSHKVKGTEIDVDFWNDSAEYFDVFFYTKYLESLRNPEPPEQRLRELFRSTRPVGLAVNDLLAAGALTPLTGRDSHPPRVSDAVLDQADAIEAFCQAWSDPANRERLIRETGYPAADALHGLAELGVADESVEHALRGEPSGLVSAALDVVEEQDDPRWCPQVHATYSRVKPTGQIPEPRIWMRSLKFLLRHGHQTEEMIAALPRAGGTEAGEAVLLALEHAPQHALPLIRKALLADIPINRTEAASILAVINKPWSIRELHGALEASDDQEKTADAPARHCWRPGTQRPRRRCWPGRSRTRTKTRPAATWRSAGGSSGRSTPSTKYC